MLKKILIIIITIFSLPISSYSNNDVSSIAEKWFYSFSDKIGKNYNSDKEIKYFEAFSSKLNKLLLDKKFTKIQQSLINDLIILSNEHIFKEKKYNIEKSNKIKLKTNSLLKGFKFFSYNPENIVLENGIWYTYVFNAHLKFPKGTKIKDGDFEYNGIDKQKTLVFLREDNLLGFVIDFKKVKLISDSLIYGIPGKYNFLKEIKDDKKKLDYDTDKYFSLLKEKTLLITKGKTKDEKIKSIYNYVLSNVRYTTPLVLSDLRIFSGIDTFKNKDGVCEGYVKMFLYMLNFSGIGESEAIRGYVIDAKDFPKIGHAWVRIGDKYYDPTFDDPITTNDTKKYFEYKYFGLPYDLFYTNRFSFDKTPSFLKEKDFSFRKSFVQKRLYSMVSKYKYSSYNILKPLTLRSEYGLELDKVLNIEDLKKMIQYYEVNDFKFNKDGKQKNIKSLKYYSITDSSVDNLIDQLNYSFNGYYLFKWRLKNGGYDYRVAYDVILK